MTSRYIIGVDIGTTSTKAVLFSQNGCPIKKESIEYPLHTPTPSMAEQDPDEIFAAVVKSIKIVGGDKPERILGVSFSSAMHSLIAMNAEGRPLTRCWTWADNRSAGWAEKIKKEMNGHDLYRRTGTPIHAMSPLSKITWMRHHQPELFSKTAKFISIKEYVFYRLFKRYIVDYSIASATGLFNMQRLDWDEEALVVAGITRDKLSNLVPTTTIVTPLSGSDAARMNLLPSAPFIIGASDGTLSNLGVGAIEPGSVAVTLGTSGAVRTVIDQPVTDAKGRFFCYSLTEKQWVIGGAVNNGGIVLRWARDQFATVESETDQYGWLTQLAGKARPGSDGLIFHPYLTGERAPLWNADARGSFFGLGLHHRKEHMVRAVMEGILYNLYSVLLALEEAAGTPTRIQATGGFARSLIWRQMMADIFGQTITVPESYESSCLGAAVLGLYALGNMDSLNSISSMVGTTRQYKPIKEHVQIYRELMPIYLRLTGKLAEEYCEITAFQRKTLSR